MSFIENTHSVAAASDNGSIHVFRVHYISSGKYGKCETVRKITLNNEYAVTMEHYHTGNTRVVLFIYTLLVHSTKTKFIQLRYNFFMVHRVAIALSVRDKPWQHLCARVGHHAASLAFEQQHLAR